MKIRREIRAHIIWTLTIHAYTQTLNSNDHQKKCQKLHSIIALILSQGNLLTPQAMQNDLTSKVTVAKSKLS